MSKVSAVIAAGGSGRRMQLPGNKVFVPVNGIPVLSYTLAIFESCDLIDEIIVVVPNHEIDICRETVINAYGIRKAAKIVAGGKERQDSVRLGLMETSEDCEYVVVHDGARPLLTPGLLQKVIRAAFSFEAAISAVPVKDTIKIGNSHGFVVDTPERGTLWSVQTPQAFKKDLLVEAHLKALDNRICGTDDAYLVEKMGSMVKIVQGEYDNIKITTPEDLDIVGTILSRRRDCDSCGHGV